MTRKEIDNMKYKVCCPMCDNKKCVRGTDSCEAEQWAKSKAESEDKKAYVLTADGWTHGYGSEIYLMGVFFDKETAEKKAKEQEDVHVSITEIEVNKIFPLKTNDLFEEKTNAYYLGGYIE